MGNTEVLVREALYAAEETGVEIAMIKLMDLDLRPCTGCLSCVESLMKGGPGRCIQKDDFAFLDEQFMDSDGVIVGAPVYVLGPNGLLKVVADRMGPTHDVSWRIEAKLIRENTGRTAGKGPDERAFKKRVAGLISVGGATTPHWASLGLPLMHFITFPPAVQVIDQVQYLGTAAVGNFVLTPERLERAKTLGRNVAEAMLKPVEERAWKGDAEGICPVCHNDLLTVTNGRNPVECPISSRDAERRRRSHHSDLQRGGAGPLPAHDRRQARTLGRGEHVGAGRVRPSRPRRDPRQGRGLRRSASRGARARGSRGPQPDRRLIIRSSHFSTTSHGWPKMTH